MNSSEELPSNYFWDSDEAEQEYYAIEQGIAETERTCAFARGRMLAVSAVADNLMNAYHVSKKYDSGYSYVYDLDSDGTKYPWKKDFDPLNHAFNPFWLWPDGEIYYDVYADPAVFHPHMTHELDQGLFRLQGSLLLRKIRSEIVRDVVGLGWEEKWYGHEWSRLAYSYEKRVEWYTPKGDLATSGLEFALRRSSCPFDVPGEYLEGSVDFEGYGELLLADCLKREPEEVQHYARSLYKKLLAELQREVHDFAASLSSQIVLKFYPSLAPNKEDIQQSYAENKKAMPRVSLPPLARFERPKVGKRYGPASYRGICWLKHGRWETHRFPLEVLNAWWDATRERLRERIKAAVRDVAYLSRGVLPNLLWQKQRIRLLHYKPNEYKVFWSLVGASVMMIPERSTGETN